MDCPGQSELCTPDWHALVDRLAGVLRFICIILSVSITLKNSATAGAPGPVLNAMGLPGGRVGQAARVEQLQTELSWIGLYRGQINGRLDHLTREAIRALQTGLGVPATGELTSRQSSILQSQAESMREAANFRTEAVDWTGMNITVPYGYFDPPVISGEENHHLEYSGRSVAQSTLWVQRYFTEASPLMWLESLRRWADRQGSSVLVDGIHGQFIYMVSLEPEDITTGRGARRYYSLYETNGFEVRGLDLSFDEEHVAQMRPMVAHVLSTFEPMSGPGVPRSQIASRLRSGDYPGGSDVPRWYQLMKNNGSGSIVSVNGHVLTNHHVVSNCERLSVNGTPSILVASDVRIDLALLLAPRMADRNPARFAGRPPDLGEQVLVLGYPVFDLSPSLNVTSGIVSSALGYRGDRTRLQITAPVQPGNSGGPVISINGAQIGVVATKPTTAAQSDRNIENIGWIIRGAEARSFLRRFGVEPLINNHAYAPPNIGVTEGLKEWRRFAVRVECLSG